MKIVALLALLTSALLAQQQTQGIRFSATTGDGSLNSAATTATLQQPATGADNVLVDQAVIYCSVACSATQAANGSAATTTAGTVTPILPSQLNITPNVKFFTASNVGTGTAQGGILHIPAGGTAVLCLSPACGNPAQVILGTGSGSAANYSITIASLTGTVNITFYGRI